ncbi:MAG: sensor histidine kinase [Cyanobacteria bacterium P01_A01_bin.84]
MAKSSIRPIAKAFPSIRRTIFYVEWTILIVHIIAVFVGGFIYGNKYVFIENTHVIILTALIILAVLSFYFPLNHPLWQRQGYIFLEVLCLVLTCILTTSALDLFLYLVIAKSCFLLSRKDAIFVAIASGIVWQISQVWHMPQKIEWMNSIFAEVFADPQRYIIYTLLTNTVVYLAVSTFIILLCFIFLAERYSHAKAVALSFEVEKLAAKLERTRIARDIHDSLGHTLTSLDIQLELAERLEERNPDKAKQAIKIAKTLASRSLQQVRQSVFTIREENFQLNQALMTLIKQFQQNNSYQMQTRLNFPSLPLQTSHQIYCIVQEGLTNIQKHSHASLVNLLGKATSSEVILNLTDDGIGFESDKPNSGYGLKGIQERVQMLGGKIKIDSTPGKGTQIKVTIPLDNQSPFEVQKT